MTDEVVRYRDDSPNGDLIDDLVADLIDAENKHVEVANAAIERLTTEYPALTERYGDWNLGISIQGPGKRIVRAAVHKALREKGMSLRAIAAETGVSKGTVINDLREVKDDRPDEGGPDNPDHSEPEAQPDTTDALAFDERDKRLTRWASGWAKVTRALADLDPEAVATDLDVDSREAARHYAESLRAMADRVDAALAKKMRVVNGGRSR